MLAIDNGNDWSIAGKPNKVALWIGTNKEVKSGVALLDKPTDAHQKNKNKDGLELTVNNGLYEDGKAKINYLYASYVCVEVYDQFGILHSNAIVRFEDVIW